MSSEFCERLSLYLHDLIVCVTHLFAKPTINLIIVVNTSNYLHTPITGCPPFIITVSVRKHRLNPYAINPLQHRIIKAQNILSLTVRASLVWFGENENKFYWCISPWFLQRFLNETGEERCQISNI